MTQFTRLNIEAELVVSRIASVLDSVRPTIELCREPS
jgi:hypothetical protein